jgi:hypothetical protein
MTDADAGPTRSAATAANTAVVRIIRVLKLSFMSRVLLDRSTMAGTLRGHGFCVVHG